MRKVPKKYGWYAGSSDYFEEDATIHQALLVQAARWGQIEDMNYLLTSKSRTSYCEVNECVIEAAIKFGNLGHLQNVLQLPSISHSGHRLFQKASRRILSVSAVSSHLKWEHLSSAVKHGYLDIVIWILLTHPHLKINWVIMGNAIQTDHDDMVDAIFHHQSSTYRLEQDADRLYKYAVNTGNMRWVYWLMSKGCPKSHITTVTAAQNGSIEMLRDLVEIGFPVTTETFEKACSIPDNLSIMEYLHSVHCPRDYRAYEMAITKSLLKSYGSWLIDHECPLDERILTHGFYYKYEVDDIKWLLDQHCPFDPQHILYDIRIHPKGVDILKLLFDCNPTVVNYSTAYSIAIKENNLDAMKWLYSKQCPLSPNVWENAQKNWFVNNNDEMINWLRDKHCPGEDLVNDFFLQRFENPENGVFLLSVITFFILLFCLWLVGKIWNAIW
jgi:hypothetical protein